MVPMHDSKVISVGIFVASFFRFARLYLDACLLNGQVAIL